MSDVPAWIQVLQALLTPAIAIAVGVIGFLQWRTAHQKVVLDLFDRRLAVYDGVVNSVTGHFSKLESPTLRSDTVSELYQLRSRALFLFGSDVANLIDEVRSDIINYALLSERREKRRPLLPQARQAADREFSEVLERLTETPERMTSACLPYIQMDSKAARTFTAWLNEKNRQRLSYADEKQR